MLVSDGDAVHVDVRNAVRAGRVDHRVEERERREVRVAAGVRDQLDPERRQGPVPLRPVRVLHDERVALGRREDRLLARVAEADGPAGLPDEEAEEAPRPSRPPCRRSRPRCRAPRSAPGSGAGRGRSATSRKCSMTWVATRRVMTPFSSSQPTPASGSMNAWSMKPVRYVPSTTTSASRRPASTSPLRDLPAGDDVAARLEAGRVGAEGDLRVEHAGSVLVLDGDQPRRLLGGLLASRRRPARPPRRGSGPSRRRAPGCGRGAAPPSSSGPARR